MTTRQKNPRRSAVAHVDPLGEPFLRTRFALPARPAVFLRRPRLDEHLDQSFGTPLTMVNGSAGAGKTLLVADWAARQRQPVAWFTTEAGDQGCGVFWAYVLEALRAAGVPLPSDIGCPGDASRVDHGLLSRLAHELNGLERPVVLVLDEFDRVTSARIAEQLEFVLHHAGRGLRLVVVTRTEPLLPLHRYRAAGAMTEIRGAELAFTVEEAAALLQLHGLRLPTAAVRALVERTGGWAAGLRLCALAARQSPDPSAYLRDFEAGRSTIADFLLTEVLKRQPVRVQDLLLRVSVVERFSPELVAELTGRGGTEPILAALHSQNAFVEDLGHSWYRLHPLFGEILRAHLRFRSPGLESELHRRAAQWLHASGALPEALAHGAAAGDWNFTTRTLVDDLAIGQLFTGLRANDLAELFSRMGPEATSAAADLVRAARELSRGDVERGLVQLRRAEERLDARPDAATRLSLVLLQSLAARLTGSPGMAEQAVATAERLWGEVPAELLDSHPEFSALLLTHVGSARLWAGRFDDARAALSTVAGCPGGVSTALPREDSLGQLALIDYLNGWLCRAERKAQASLRETERFGLRDPGFPGAGLGQLVLAAVAVDRDELRAAQALLDEAAAASGAPRDPVTAAGRSLATSRLLLSRGEPRAAAAAADLDVPALVDSPWAEVQTALVASAAHLAEGRTESALKVLDDVSSDGEPTWAAELAWARFAAGNQESALDLLDHMRTHRHTGPRAAVQCALVRAGAAQETDVAAARKLLAGALLQARRERLRRPFLEAGPRIRHLLDSPPLQDLAAGWLTPCRPAPPGGPGSAGDGSSLVVEELSGREREVVGRLAELMSTEEIAADLYVSVNTVKTHLKSAYRKLGVNGRAEAVRRARDQGLI